MSKNLILPILKSLRRLLACSSGMAASLSNSNMVLRPLAVLASKTKSREEEAIGSPMFIEREGDFSI